MNVPMRLPATMHVRVSPQLRYDRKHQVIFACCVLALLTPPLIWLANPDTPERARQRAQAVKARLEQRGGAELRGGAAAASRAAPLATLPPGLVADSCAGYRPQARGQPSDDFRPLIRPLCCDAAANSPAAAAAARAPPRRGGAAGAAAAPAGGCPRLRNGALPATAVGGEALVYPAFRARLPRSTSAEASAALARRLAADGVGVVSDAAAGGGAAAALWAAFPAATGLTLRHGPVLLNHTALGGGGDACWLPAGGGGSLRAAAAERGALPAAVLLDGLRPLLPVQGGGGGAGGGGAGGGGASAEGAAAQWARLAQVEHWALSASTTFLVASQPAAGGSDGQWWRLLGGGGARHLLARRDAAGGGGAPQAEAGTHCNELAHPCRVPLHHPYLLLRRAEDAYARAGASRLGQPSGQPRTVVWAAAAAAPPGGGGGGGGGARIAREADLRAALGAWLRERGHQLKVLSPAPGGGGSGGGEWPFANMGAALAFFGARVVAVVGAGEPLAALAEWGAVGLRVVEAVCVDGAAADGDEALGGGRLALGAAPPPAWLASAARGHEHWLVPAACGGGGAGVQLEVQVAQLLAAFNATLGAPWRSDPSEWLRPAV